jgi:hypothetical protein
MNLPLLKNDSIIGVFTGACRPRGGHDHGMDRRGQAAATH